MKVTTSGIGCGKERVPGARRGRAGQCHAAPADSPLTDAGVLQQAGALPDRHGSLRQQPLLGEEAHGPGSYGAADGAAVREPYRKNDKNDGNDAEAICSFRP